MLSIHLAVDEGEALVAKAPDEGDEGRLRRVVLPAEHGLAEEHAAQGDAVESADELAGAPDFRGVGVAQAVELDIGLDHGLGDPGAVLAGPGRGGAGSDHGGEVAVQAELEPPPPKDPPHRLRDVELLGEEDESRVGAMPEDGVALGEPGEYAPLVGREEEARGEVAADADDAPLVRRRGIGEGKVRFLAQVGEGRLASPSVSARQGLYLDLGRGARRESRAARASAFG